MNVIIFHIVNLYIFSENSYPQISGHGYPSHFIIGAFIAGLVFYWFFKKKNSYLKSWILALTIVSAIGLAKELIDPYIGRQRDKTDLLITILGGIIGAGFVALFKNNKKA